MKNIRDDFLKSHERLHGALYSELINEGHLQKASDTTFFGVPCHVYELKSDPTCKVYFGINNQWYFNNPYMLQGAIKVMHWYRKATKIAQGFDKAHQSGTYSYVSASNNMKNSIATRLDNNWKQDEQRKQHNKFININHLQIKNGIIQLHTLVEFSYDKIFKHNIIPRLIYDHIFNVSNHVFDYRWINLSDILSNHTKYHIYLPYYIADSEGHDYRKNSNQIHKFVRDTPVNRINQPKCFIVNDTLKPKLVNYIKQQIEYLLLLNDSNKKTVKLQALIKD